MISGSNLANNCQRPQLLCLGEGGGEAVVFMFGWGPSDWLSMPLHIDNETHHYQRNQKNISVDPSFVANLHKIN